MQPPRTTAVLVHASTGTETFGKNVNCGATGTVTNKLNAPALFRASFGPPHIVATNSDLTD
jgi:hypothetical protein